MRQELVQLGNGAHALAIQILGNSEVAADAVHDAFASVLEKPASYEGNKGPLKPWFLRVVRNRCIDLLRKRRTDTVSHEETADTAAGPETAAEISQRDAAIRAALHSLDAQQRQIIVLRDYLDLTYAEIAGVIDIPAGTVMSRLHRARVALGKAYRERYDEPFTD